MNFLLGIFGNIKNMVMAAGAIFISLYVARLKYEAYQAEDKLKTIETKIAKTNVVVAKTKAKAKAKAVEVETTARVEILRELKKESERVQKEMEVIEDNIEKEVKKKAKVQGRTRSKSFEIEV